MEKDDRMKYLFQDIGKCTLRGVRKCPKCGTRNGMRGVCCKNLACNAIFKEAGERRKYSHDVCKLNTRSSTQIYSVRVQDKGPDYRGFVQLPMANKQTNFDNSSCLCFVDNCQKTFTTTVLKCHEKELEMRTACQHIRMALHCTNEAQHIELANSVLETLNIPQDLKKAIKDLTKGSTGPIVQRVSKSVFVVKCRVTSKHPLGYLHIIFNVGNPCNYMCSCPISSKGNPYKCLHFYACVAAFASCKNLIDEFDCFVNPVQPVVCLSLPSGSSKDSATNQKQHAAFLEVVAKDCNVKMNISAEEVAMLEQFASIRNSEFATMGVSQIPSEVNRMPTDVSGINMEPFDIRSEIAEFFAERQCMSQPQSTVLEERKNKAVKKRGNGKHAPCGGLLNTVVKKPRKSLATSPKATVARTDQIYENSTHQSFIDWLGSVTEMINLNMHFAFSGKPRTLIFEIPENFFACFRERVSTIGNKRLLPVVTNHGEEPRHSCTKYTWKVTNIFHCKQIFETPKVPLEITRSFMQNRDGSYEPFVLPSIQDELYSKLLNSPRIKPLELQTYLKVGRTSVEQEIPTPLIIEWIPNKLPKSKFGELRITYEYGHRKQNPKFENLD